MYGVQCTYLEAHPGMPGRALTTTMTNDLSPQLASNQPPAALPLSSSRFASLTNSQWRPPRARHEGHARVSCSPPRHGYTHMYNVHLGQQQRRRSVTDSLPLIRFPASPLFNLPRAATMPFKPPDAGELKPGTSSLFLLYCFSDTWRPG